MCYSVRPFCNVFEMRMERIIQDKIHLYHTKHEAFILIKLEVLEVSHERTCFDRCTRV